MGIVSLMADAGIDGGIIGKCFFHSKIGLN